MQVVSKGNNMINGMTPEDYAAMWGCEPVYDKPPRKHGDGCMFYNYCAEKDNPEFLRKFLDAIDRTSQSVINNKYDDWKQDLVDLDCLKNVVADQLKVAEKYKFAFLIKISEPHIVRPCCMLVVSYSENNAIELAKQKLISGFTDKCKIEICGKTLVDNSSGVHIVL